MLHCLGGRSVVTREDIVDLVVGIDDATGIEFTAGEVLLEEQVQTLLEYLNNPRDTTDMVDLITGKPVDTAC